MVTKVITQSWKVAGSTRGKVNLNNVDHDQVNQHAQDKGPGGLNEVTGEQ